MLDILEMDQNDGLGLAGLQIAHDHNVIQGAAVITNQMNHKWEILQNENHHRKN